MTFLSIRRTQISASLTSDTLRWDTGTEKGDITTLRLYSWVGSFLFGHQKNFQRRCRCDDEIAGLHFDLIYLMRATLITIILVHSSPLGGCSEISRGERTCARCASQPGHSWRRLVTLRGDVGVRRDIVYLLGGHLVCVVVFASRREESYVSLFTWRLVGFARKNAVIRGTACVTIGSWSISATLLKCGVFVYRPLASWVLDFRMDLVCSGTSSVTFTSQNFERIFGWEPIAFVLDVERVRCIFISWLLLRGRLGWRRGRR